MFKSNRVCFQTCSSPIVFTFNSVQVQLRLLLIMFRPNRVYIQPCSSPIVSTFDYVQVQSFLLLITFTSNRVYFQSCSSPILHTFSYVQAPPCLFLTNSGTFLSILHVKSHRVLFVCLFVSCFKELKFRRIYFLPRSSSPVSIFFIMFTYHRQFVIDDHDQVIFLITFKFHSVHFSPCSSSTVSISCQVQVPLCLFMEGWGGGGVVGELGSGRGGGAPCSSFTVHIFYCVQVRYVYVLLGAVSLCSSITMVEFHHVYFVPCSI